MQHVQLANETSLNRVAYGALRLPAIRANNEENQHASKALLKRAVSLGVNMIDTAHFYGNRTANRLIYEALHPYPDTFVIATKAGVVLGDDGRPQPGAEPAAIRSVVEDDLKSLHVDQLSLVYLRLPGGPLPDSGVPLAESLGELVRLKEEGKIRHIGLSSATIDQVKHALQITPIVAIQNHFNLSDQSSRDVLDLCTKEQMVFLPYFPLQMGNYEQQETQKLAQLEAIANRHQRTTAQIILAWLLALSPQIVVIPGTSRIEHLEQNMASAEIKLTKSEIQSLVDA